MINLSKLSIAERDIFINQAAEKINMPNEIVEKDYWVVWTLEQLFSIEKLKPYLTFKGGTSLSKIYDVIDRFSEDIDVSIEKELFGFHPLNTSDNSLSKKKQRTLLDNLTSACAQYVQNELLEDLQQIFCFKLGTSEGWNLSIDQDDKDGQTLLFEYPCNTTKTGYIRPIIKIELGARSEHWPVSEHKIQSYTKQALSDAIYEPQIVVRVLNAERTFWEKATILHQYAHLPQDKKLPQRISRHYYDFFRLLNSDIKHKAISNSMLLEKVSFHKSIYFASSWASYETAKRGSLKLIPPLHITVELEHDYILMQNMFFREVPGWTVILKTIKAFETEFNNNSDYLMTESPKNYTTTEIG